MEVRKQSDHGQPRQSRLDNQQDHREVRDEHGQVRVV